MSEPWKFMEEVESCCHQNRLSHRGPVTDILLWIECYSIFIAVLASQYSTKVPQMMTYQKTILKAHKTYCTLDKDGQHISSTANTKCLDWDVIDFTLYNETFSGWAKVISRCHHCS